MDQESNSGRRRSSRLAARGVTTPRAEAAVKKTVKSSEKPKRSKRKTTEEVIELPEAKKTKTENKTSDEVDNAEINNASDVEKNEISAMDVDNNDTSVLPPSSEEENAKPTIEDKTDAPTQDSKEQEVIENIPVAKENKEKIDTSLSTDDKKQTEAAEDSIKIKDPETTEPLKNDVLQEETKQESVVLENSNGTSDEKETVEPVEVIKSDNGFCVAKDNITPNGDTNDTVKPEIKSTNGDQSLQKLEVIETIKVLEDKNHTIETEIKAVTTPTIVITASSNDASSVEQVEKELEKTVENVDDKSIPADDNAPIVDQSSTVVS